MKKIMTVLLLVAATMNVMAVEFTAGAKVRLTSTTSGQTCDLTLAQSDEYGALDGAEMNMEGRKVAFYGLNGTTKLQIVQGKDLTNVKIGLLTDASTEYTLTVLSVLGTKTLKLRDAETGLVHELKTGSPITFSATANSTIDNRFILNYVAADELDVCFIDNKLEIKANPYEGQDIVIKDKDGNDITGSPFAAEFPTQTIDLSGIGQAGDRFTVEFNNGARKFVIVKH